MKNQKTKHDVFQFTIGQPLRNATASGKGQYITIVQKAPTFVFYIQLQGDLAYEEQLRLAKAELKLAMIAAITDGEWELENA